MNLVAFEEFQKFTDFDRQVSQSRGQFTGGYQGSFDSNSVSAAVKFIQATENF